MGNTNRWSSSSSSGSRKRPVSHAYVAERQARERWCFTESDNWLSCKTEPRIALCPDSGSLWPYSISKGK